ncbi:uncharacterized protein EKO05_0008547 [Ascochyta rabiei]|uniref:Uncharacterized protein n=1 Tax=Didymella rabiei TaxID=5454 RepID=A0A163ML43_DIDRA|nr:uncharacterized protein EKO05_0008547 [Ascochyta rabiei]KZM28810.1 hypothetical protein ST47_g25 [Ascochyta rabiei]UPX18240.1 hypothetical protein EKO05_0008547 [Ascochyta rabiei]
MRATTAILALVGTALAAPNWQRPQPNKEVENVHIVYETVLYTVYQTEGQDQPKPTKASTPVPQPPVVTTIVYEENTPTPTPTSPVVVYETKPPAPPSTKAAATPAAPAPAAPTPAAPAPAAPASGYQAIVDTWRAKMGLKPLTNDDKLQSNAKDCVVSSNGQMVHKLNPGSYGQVLAPGNADDFEHVFVGGWLCEIPTLPGLDGICSTQSDGWAYEGQTGHAEILTSDNYSKIGCALYAGIWACDLA